VGAAGAAGSGRSGDGGTGISRPIVGNRGSGESRSRSRRNALQSADPSPAAGELSVMAVGEVDHTASGRRGPLTGFEFDRGGGRGRGRGPDMV
jgi:hypothetical protein